MNETDARLRSTALDLRLQAENCLADEAPTAATAHELANRVLDLLRLLGAFPNAPSTPYRGRPPSEGDETSRAVTLERALEACQERLRSTVAELEALRAAR